MDRRLIHERIGQLKSELEDVKRHREVTRKQRDRKYTLSAAIVGYAIAGKSTLLNTLTGAGILAQDKLFATLDPTTRGLKLASGQEILLTDTVGFIRKLPHHLIEAFKSTLEEARYSDIVLHVVDASNQQMDTQMYVVYDTLRQLEIGDKTVVTVFNKMDQVEQPETLKDLHSDYQVQISAKTGAGLDELKDILEMILRNRKIYLEKVFSYQEAGRIQTNPQIRSAFKRRVPGRWHLRGGVCADGALRRADALTGRCVDPYGKEVCGEKPYASSSCFEALRSC